MSRIFSTCAECGRTFQDYDEAPTLWCSVYCETQPARFAATEARGAAAERAAVVAWLQCALQSVIALNGYSPCEG